MPATKNPVLISSLGYRKAVVRHCTEQLREIEGRLEQPSGPRWEHSLAACEDLGGVGRLLLTLQRRTSLANADNTWLEELSQLKPDDVDDRAIELVRATLFIIPFSQCLTNSRFFARSRAASKIGLKSCARRSNIRLSLASLLARR